MSKRKFRLGLIWTLVLGLLPAAVWAAGPPPPPTAPPTAPMPQRDKAAVGLDLVLLIDQSDSMGGSKIHPEQNDPHAKRISAVELVAHLLSTATESHYLANGSRVSHQIGIVEFGTTARVALPGAVIEFDPQLSQSARDVQLNHILSSIQANVLGYTNHLHAFELAEGLLQQMRQKNLPGPRRQLVLMVTDGQSYLDGMDLRAYQTKMQQYLRQHFLDQGIAIEVVGLDAADKFWVKSKAGAYWQQTTDGHARRIENPDDFYEALKTIILQYVTLAGKRVSVEKNYDCPPYLDHLTATGDRHIIARPMPGMWRFSQLRRAGACRGNMQRLYTQVMFVAPQAPLDRQQASPLQGAPFRGALRFPVTMSAGAIWPGGKDMGPIPATHDGQGSAFTLYFSPPVCELLDQWPEVRNPLTRQAEAQLQQFHESEAWQWFQRGYQEFDRSPAPEVL
ncbi:MAG: vWA domain-containing protein [Pseudomonadota bacterium]